MKVSQFLAKKIPINFNREHLFLSKNRISLQRYFSVHVIATALVGYITNRNELWPSIDSLAPLKSMLGIEDFNSELDYFTNDSIETNGKTPFLKLLFLICSVLEIDPILCVSILSMITFTLTLPTLMLALYYSTNYRVGTILETRFLYLSLMPICLYPVWIKLPGIYFAGFGPFFGPLVTPTFIAILLTSVSLILISKNKIMISRIKLFSCTLLILLSTVTHFTITLLLVAIWCAMRYSTNKLSLDQIKTTSIPLFLGIFLLKIFFHQSSDQITSEEFVQIYAQIRHPHHYWFSSYFHWQALVVYIGSFLIIYFWSLGVKDKNTRKAVSMLFLVFVFLNLAQFIFVELFPIKDIAIFGPSRVNIYILISLFVLACNLLIKVDENVSLNYKLNESRFSKQHSYKDHLFNSLIAVLIIISAFFLTLRITDDFNMLSKTVKKELSLIGLKDSDLVLVDVRFVNTLGWREFGKVNVWLDWYFVFNEPSILKYSQRWYELCGNNIASNCDNNLFTMIPSDLHNYFVINEIDKVVLTKENDLLADNNFFEKYYESDRFITYEPKLRQ